ncbi:GDSL-type esterase/lipase family protein [Paenibacillus taichungensis]|uniref:SGNH/GDSL hydrolase family protein n=1 Tax=Paenibacillus taichungensis TaxID=484184 RepID=UPI002DBE25E8|nr:GDSL-type esterase/lipase family protein [Paenibacillus taichungensis]MEC0110423.1 GDSL-type esterase/lipase family protein [Paenibacillus taichungensis]MEC0200099.1 GDSL-type esterase/lipase family protein [Paenibacillus taichungensis]
MADKSSKIAGAALGAAESALSRYNGNSMACIGDSLFGLGFDAASSGIGASVWPHQFMMMSGGRIKFAYNAGVSGERTDQILARFQTAVIDRKPSFVFICGGTNDYIQGYAVADTLNNIEKMVKMGLESRITPVLSTVPPKQDGDHLKIQQHNAGLRKLSQKYGLHLIDIYTILVDPATGDIRTQYKSDDRHYNIAGAKAIGQIVANEFLPKLPAYVLDLPGMNNGPRNLLKNSLFVTAGTGGLAGSWSLNGTAVDVTSSLVAATDPIRGNWLVMDKTAATASAGSKNYYQQITTGFKPGDRILFMGRFKSEIEASTSKLTVQLQWTGASGFIRPLNAWATDNDGVFNIEATVPAGTTSLTVTMALNDGLGKVSFAQLAVYNLTNDPY